MLICKYSFSNSVPASGDKRKKWIEAIEKHQEFDYCSSKYYICEQHFERDSINIIGKRKNVKPNAIPSIFPDV